VYFLKTSRYAGLLFQGNGIFLCGFSGKFRKIILNHKIGLKGEKKAALCYR
jgi:hypothetical protein